MVVEKLNPTIKSPFLFHVCPHFTRNFTFSTFSSISICSVHRLRPRATLRITTLRYHRRTKNLEHELCRSEKKMSLFRRLDFLLDSPPPLPLPNVTTTTSFLLPFSDDLLYLEERRYQQQLGFALDFLAPSPLDVVPFPSPLKCPALPAVPCADLLDTPFDLFEIRKYERSHGLRSLSDRVEALEHALKERKVGPLDRQYKWTAEIKGEGALDRKYKCVTQVKAGGERGVKWTAEIKGDGIVDRKYKCVAQAKAGGERDIKWTEEIKGMGVKSPARTYTIQAVTAPSGVEKGKSKKKCGNKGSTSRVVEITDPQTDRGTVHLKKAFVKRSVDYSKRKMKELSPEDAAVMIQMAFREYVIRRSQVLRGLRELAVAKAKLKEIRALFSNFSYRRRIANDAEESQRFSEKIIVLLLTVDAIEGPDYMIRAAKKSMIDELEAMLGVVDPQISGKLGSLRRRTFDLPGGSAIHKEMALGVADVVQLLNEEEGMA